MIRAHVLNDFLINTVPLLVMIDLGIEVLPRDAKPVHHFPDEFVPLNILSL